MKSHLQPLLIYLVFSVTQINKGYGNKRKSSIIKTDADVSTTNASATDQS